jgi:hypothetical protein
MWRRRAILWVIFALLSVWLGWLGWIGESAPYGDVSYVYRYWAGTAESGGPIVGIATQWVYPILALVPILLANVAGSENYALTWIAIVTLANALAFALLLGRNHTAPARRIAAWWWLAFLLALGPISVARLDSLVTPLAIAGLLLALCRPATAAILLTIGLWIKVWPVALLVSFVVSARRRWLVALSVAFASISVVLMAAIAGAGWNVFSFLSQQTSRGLQIESPWATPFLWLAALHIPGYKVEYNRDLLTFEASGVGTVLMANAASGLLVVVIAAILIIAFALERRGTTPLQLLPALGLALTITLIAFNKVGSPQYIGWLAAPVVAGLVFDRRRFYIAACLVILTALTTQLFYPFAYEQVLTLQPAALVALTIRNILELVTFVIALRLLITSKVKV